MRHQIRLHIQHPAMTQAKTLRVVGKNPWRIFARQFDHLINHRLPFRAVVHIFHAHKQAVKFGILIVRRVFTTDAHLFIWPIQQEQKVFRIRVISVPAPLKNLRTSLSHFVLKTIVVRRTDD